MAKRTDITGAKRGSQRAQDCAQMQAVHMALHDAQLRADRHERLSTLGARSACVVHEINNPLTYVAFNLASLKEELAYLRQSGADSVNQRVNFAAIAQDVSSCLATCEALVADSMQGVERIREIVADVKTMAYDREASSEWVNLRATLEMALRLAGADLTGRAEVIREIDGVPAFLGYSKQISQVFINLLVNAAQAMTSYGKIVVRARQIGEMVKIEIEDNGSGIPTAFQDRIFDPFFTTKPSGQGTGLGLGVVWEIVKRHRGEIAFTSAEGRGTTFVITLPIEHPDLKRVWEKEHTGEKPCTRDVFFS